MDEPRIRTFTQMPDLDAARDRKADTTIAVVLPARDEAATVGDICARLVDHPLIDDLVVIDGGSTDDTRAVAGRAGARVVDAAEVLPAEGPVLGKGDSLWRSLAATDADIVCWIDADIERFDPSFVTRLVGPLLQDEDLMFVKGFYRRPLGAAPRGGGRVTELLAKPLLAATFPELSSFDQPLAGEYAGRRSVLERIPFRTGYSVEVAMLIDLLHLVGLGAMAQADLVERRHRNRALSDLAPMADAIARTIMARAEQHGRLMTMLDLAADEVERPPMVTHRLEVR